MAQRKVTIGDFMKIIMFLIGVVVGVIPGFMLCALISADNDAYMDKYELKEQSEYLKDWAEKHKKKKKE